MALDYDFYAYRAADLVRMDILVHGNRVDALSRSFTERRRKGEAAKFLQNFEKKSISTCSKWHFRRPSAADYRRETIAAMKKNVTAKCYGGDITRKRKLWSKQAEGSRHEADRTGGGASGGVPRDSRIGGLMPCFSSLFFEPLDQARHSFLIPAKPRFDRDAVNLKRAAFGSSIMNRPETPPLAPHVNEMVVNSGTPETIPPEVPIPLASPSTDPIAPSFPDADSPPSKQADVEAKGPFRDRSPFRLLLSVSTGFLTIFLFLRTFAVEPFGVPTGSIGSVPDREPSGRAMPSLRLSSENRFPLPGRQCQRAVRSCRLSKLR